MPGCTSAEKIVARVAPTCAAVEKTLATSPMTPVWVDDRRNSREKEEEEEDRKRRSEKRAWPPMPQLALLGAPPSEDAMDR